MVSSAPRATAAPEVDFIGMNSYPVGMRSVVSEKGQVTIPKALRDRLGIRPGEVLDFEEHAGQLVATKVALEDPVDAVYGILEIDRSSDALVDQLRGPRPT
jgi:antitoxin PrlF